MKPGGRVCAAVWAQPDGNPWATIPMGAIATEVDLPPAPRDAPGLFRCAAPGAIGDVFVSAGLHDVSETDVRASLTTASAEEYWGFMTEVAAPVIAGLSMVDDDARARIRNIVIDQVNDLAVEGRPQLRIHARCITAHRPGVRLPGHRR